MANPLICVFNPITTLIDVIPAASIGPTTPNIPVVTNLNGLVDTSLLGLGSLATAGETISAGQLVNIYSQSGTLHAQVAWATNVGTAPSGALYPIQAQGFANSNAITGGTLTVNFTGTFIYIDGNAEFSGANIGQEVFLSAVTKGGVTLTAPVALEEAVGYVVAFQVPNTVTINFIAGFQDFSHISGVNPVVKGGTGASTAPQALINLIGGTPTTGQALIWNGTAWVPGTDTTTFGQITTGVNNAATMTVGTGATLTFSGTGVLNANQIQGNPISPTAPTTGQALVWNGSSWAPSNAAVTAFNDITSGVNLGQTLTVGNGSSLVVSGTGIVEATQLWAVLVSSTPPTTGQTLVASSPTAAAWATPTASFDNVTSGTNVTATMTVGSGASIVVTGTGVVEATELATTGAPVVVNTAAPPSVGQSLVATSATAAHWATPPAGAAGGSPTQIQYNLGGILTGIAGSSVTAAGAVALAPTGTGIALSITGDAAASDIQQWFKFGAGTPAVKINSAGTTIITVDAVGGTALNVNGQVFFDQHLSTAGGAALTITGDNFGVVPIVQVFTWTPSNQEVVRINERGHLTVQPQGLVGTQTVATLTAVGDNNSNNIQESWAYNGGTPALAVWVDTLGTLSAQAGFATHIVTKTTTYTALATDHTINCDATGGAFTLTLPTVGIEVGQEYYIKKIDSSANAITVSSSVNIDGSLTQSLSVQYQSITVQWDGTQWWIY